MATWSDVRRLALALPGASEKRTFDGNASWTVSKKLFAWERPLRAPDIAALGDGARAGPILAVRTADLEMKDVLLASNPRVYFTVPHFDGYPVVLIQLEKIAVKELEDVTTEAWLARAGKRAVAAFLKKRGA